MNRVESTAASAAGRMMPLTNVHSSTTGKFLTGATQFWCGCQPAGSDLGIPVLDATQRDSIGRMSAAELIGVRQGSGPASW